MSAVWLMVLADEVVALLEALGRVLNFPMVRALGHLLFSLSPPPTPPPGKLVLRGVEMLYYKGHV